MLQLCQSYLIVLLIHLVGTHSLSLFQGTNPKIIQDVVWLYSNSSSLDYTNNDFSPIFYDDYLTSLSSDMNQINKTGLRGILYDRGYSCSRMTNSNDGTLPSPIYNRSDPTAIQRVALIKVDSQCSFRDKMMNAQMDGASACIIYPPSSNQAFPPPQNVDIYNGSVTIPMFYVPNDIGQHLFSQLNSISISTHSLSFNNNGGYSPITANQVVRVLLLPASSGTPNPWEITLLIMIVFLATGFISSVCLHTYLWRKNRRLQRMIEEGRLPPTLDMLPMGKRILNAAKIDLFPTRIITQKDVDDKQKMQKRMSAFTSSSAATGQSSSNDDAHNSADIDDNTCVICLDTLSVEQKVRQLPCQHEYHCHCIDPWLTSKSGECPLCKFDCVGHVTSPEEQKATEEAHAYYLNTDVNILLVFLNYIRQRRFVPSLFTSH